MARIGIGSMTLTDLSDAIIAGTQPSSTNEGQLWIDTSGDPPVLKVYHNGEWQIQHLDVMRMDEGLATEITKVIDTLGSMTNDNNLSYNDRITLLTEINRLIGRIASTKTIDNFPTGLPTIEDLDSSNLGSISITRKSALKLGIDPNDTVYTDVELEYNNLRNYLNGLNNGIINPWDITTINSLTNLTIDGDEFREKWLNFYNAVFRLETEILSVPGPAGQPAVSMILSNENINIATDNDGANGDYSRAFTEIHIYEGTKEVTSYWTLTASTDNSIIGSLVGNKYTITDITSSVTNTYIEFTARREGYADIVKRLTISKSKTGEAAISEWLTYSTSVLSKDISGLFTPTTISFSGKRRIGGGDILPLKGIFKIYESTGSNELLKYDTSVTSPGVYEDTKTWVPSDSDIVLIRVEFYSSDNRFIDSQTIVVVSDGLNATEPVTLTVDNDTIIIPTDSNGDPYSFSYDYSDVTVTAYLGNKYINLTTTNNPYILLFIPETGITGTKVVKADSNRYTFKISEMTLDVGSINIVLTNNKGLELAQRTVTVYKNKDGSIGKDGISAIYRYLSVPKVIAISLDSNNVASYHPTTFNVFSYLINGNEARIIDPDVKILKLYSEDTRNGVSSFLMDLSNGSSTNIMTILSAIGSGVDYRNYRLKITATRGTITETEYIEIISDGKHGNDGTSKYVWIVYANNIDGSGMTTDPTDKKYMGISITSEDSQPTTPDRFTWMLIKGKDGISGADGSQLHIKYSNDGGISFTANNGETVGTYIGIYIDYNPTDSNVPSDYTWNKIVGENAITGFLTNDNITFPANYKGKVSSYIDNTGYFEVYDGITRVTTTSNVTYSVVTDSVINLDITIDNLGKYTINSITDGVSILSGKASLKAIYKGVEIIKDISISKVLSGKSPINAILTNDNMTFPADSNGIVLSYVGNTGNFIIYDGVDEVIPTDVDFSVASSNNVIGNIDVNGKYTITSINNLLSTLSGNITFKAVYNDVTILKTVNVSKSISGKDGILPIIYKLQKSDSIILQDNDLNYNPNEVTFEALYIGEDNDYIPFDGYFTIYEQIGNALTMDEYITIANDPNLFDPSKEYTIGKNNIVLNKIFENTKPISSITYYPTSKETYTADEYMTLSLADQIQQNKLYLIANKKRDYKLYDVNADLNDLVRYDPGKDYDVISIIAYLYSDAERTKLVDVETISIAKDGKDGIDSYRVEIISDKGNIFKNGQINAILSAKLFRGYFDITNTIPESNFIWKRISNDTNSDTTWNNNHNTGSRTLSITKNDVKIKAVFECTISNIS